jgi:hypothetical protein
VKRIAGWGLMICLGLLFMATLAKGVVPGAPGKSVVADYDAGQYYHPGKTPRTVPGGGYCAGQGCHDGASHKRGAGLAAFRNMHSTFVDCLVCHAPDGLDRFEGRLAETGRRHLRYKGGTPPTGARGHPALAAAPGCRKCHSEGGVAILKQKGLPSLPSNFTDPIALRMQEGGARKWNP